MSASEWICIVEGDDTMYINVSTIRKVWIRDPDMTWMMEADHGSRVERYSAKLMKVGILTEEAENDVEYHIHVEAHEAAGLQDAMEGGHFSRKVLHVIDVDQKHLKPAS